MRGCCIEHDLIILAGLLDKPVGLLTTNCSRGAAQDIIDRTLAIYCGEDPFLCGTDGQGEVGLGVSPIDKDGHETGGHPAPRRWPA